MTKFVPREIRLGRIPFLPSTTPVRSTTITTMASLTSNLLDVVYYLKKIDEDIETFKQQSPAFAALRPKAIIICTVIIPFGDPAPPPYFESL